MQHSKNLIILFIFKLYRFSKKTNATNIDELLEDALNAFDDIWKLDECNFPEENIINLFDIIGNFYTKIFCHKI